MVSSKMVDIKQAGHDVKKLAELMDSYHSLSQVYDTRPKATLKKRTIDNEGVPPLYREGGDFANSNSIPKPVPPLIQRKGRKYNQISSHDSSKKRGKPDSKPGKEMLAKFHSGKGVGVKIFKLKDSNAEVNVLRSVPVCQDDLKYAFHREPQKSISPDDTLYQEALTSPRKYANLNSRNHTLKPRLETLGSKRAQFKLDKANTIGDLDFDRENKQKRDYRLSRGYVNDVFANENSDVFAEANLRTVDNIGIDTISKGTEIGKRRGFTQNPAHCDVKNAVQNGGQIHSMRFTDNSDNDIRRRQAADIFEQNLKKASEKITEAEFEMDRIPGVLKMPKFVRAVEEINAENSFRRSGRMLPERSNTLSASSYYISAQPYLASLSSITASDQVSRVDSRISDGSPAAPANTPHSKNTPFSSPRNAETSPLPAATKRNDTSKSNRVVSIPKGRDDIGRNRASDLKKTRKVMAGSKGKIRKSGSLKDPNLETCVQGRSFSNAVSVSDGTESPKHVGQSEGDNSRTIQERSKDVENTDEVKKGGDRPIFDVCESFVIRAKQPARHGSSQTSPDEPKTPKIARVPRKKLSPLHTETRRSKFILARTDKSLTGLEKGPVRLVSDPVSFSVRHPVYASCDAEVSRSIPKLSRNVLLGKSADFGDTSVKQDAATVVFYHHESRDGKFKGKDEKNDAMPGSDELNSRLTPDKQLVESTESANVGANMTSHDENRRTRKNGFRLLKIAETEDRMSQRLNEDRVTFLRLMERELTRETLPITKSLRAVADIEQEILRSPSLSAMWKKFSLGEDAPTVQSYATLASKCPIKHDGPEELKVEIENTPLYDSKSKQLAFKLNYVLSDATRSFTFPFGPPIKPQIKSVKSVSSGSDESGPKSLSITDLNLELHPGDRHKHWFTPNVKGEFGRRKRKRVSLDDEAQGCDDFQSSLAPLPEIAKSGGGSVNGALYFYVDRNSAAILPDPGSTYRFAHDVSFDEGSRYRTTDLHNGFKANPSDHGLNGLTRQFSSAVAMRNQDNGRSDLRISSRDHSSNGNNSNAKDAARSSASNDKCDLPPTLSPTSPTISPAVAASSSNTAFIPPPSASRQQNAPTCATVPPSNITFRLHKEKRNWNDRLGDLSINGGGYSNSHSAGSNAKSDAEPMLRMNMTSAVQRSLQTRERALAVATKSRISSRYSNKNGSASSEPNYSDPCMAAPPSFQQRLMDLSMLESETVKYERNRKLRRKKNQDKDS